MGSLGWTSSSSEPLTSAAFNHELAQVLFTPVSGGQTSVAWDGLALSSHLRVWLLLGNSAWVCLSDSYDKLRLCLLNLQTLQSVDPGILSCFFFLFFFFKAKGLLAWTTDTIVPPSSQKETKPEVVAGACLEPQHLGG